jgi:hypothetical protein
VLYTSKGSGYGTSTVTCTIIMVERLLLLPIHVVKLVVLIGVQTVRRYQYLYEYSNTVIEFTGNSESTSTSTVLQVP